MNNKQYTKKQILEAISFWTKRLNLLDESKSQLIDALEKEFGHDVVFSDFMDYNLTQDACEKIFNILNKHFFSNSLKLIDILWCPESKLIQILNNNAVKSGRPDKQIKQSNCYGVYTGVCNDIVNEDGEIEDIAVSDEAILMNSTTLTTCTFIFAVACICHEMIHYYDRFTQEFHDKQLESSKTKEEFDSHMDQAFQAKKLEAHENGIDVEENFSRLGTYKNINSKARYVLRQAIGENEDSNSGIFGNEQSLFIKNDKTGKMFFAFFD